MDKKMTVHMWLALFTLYIAWGSTYLAIRFAVESLPPFFMLATRFLVAGLVLYAWRRLAGDPAPSPQQWRSATIIGMLMLIGGLGGVAWAEQTVPSGITALIVAAVPLWIVLVDALRPGGKRPSWLTASGLLVGMSGILILAGPALGAAVERHNPLTSVIVLLLATLSWAIGSVYSRGAQLPRSPLLGSGMEMLAGSAGLYFVGLATGEVARLELAAVSTRSVLGLAYLIVIGSLVGFVAYTWLLRAAPTSTVATYAFVNPIVAVVLGSLLAQEVLTTEVLIAIPMILSAVALIHFANRRKVEEGGRRPIPQPRGGTQPEDGRSLKQKELQAASDL
jgi:drug/metabolite transporter (DMT)-like permease